MRVPQIPLDYRRAKRFLSFAWLAWDVINEIRRAKIIDSDGISHISFDPLSDRLSKHIDEVISVCQRNEKFDKFKKEILNSNTCLRRYCRHYIGN
jgi:hypothetical protein